MCHHNNCLMRYFEFLYGSGIICLPLNIPKILHWQVSLKSKTRQELHRLRLTWYNKIPTHPEEQHLPFKQTGTTIIFHTDTNPVFGHVLIHSFNKAHVLVVTMELIWLLLLNILSFNFVLTPNKFLSGGPDSEEAM